MSTKKATEKATECAGCEKRDATIKRQEQEMTGLRGTAEYWQDAFVHAAHERDAIQSQLDDAVLIFFNIRAACEDAGIPDKGTSLDMVKALAEDAKRYKRSADGIDRLRDVMTADTNTFTLTKVGDGAIKCVRNDTPVTTDRPSALPWIILALNLAILGCLLTM